MINTISPTLQCQNLVEERKKKKLKVYNFGLGANPIPQPEYYIQSLKKHAHKKEYTSCEGIHELNNTLKKIYDNNKMTYDILVGNGLKELLFIIQACFKGKIFHITPSWVSYKEHINILDKNSDLIEIDTNMENHFEINFDLLENELMPM